jgi:hypothetical protein
MPHTKVANRRKRRTKAAPVLGAAGLSFSLATGTLAAVGSITPDPAASRLVGQPRMEEEQISDVSLATFHVPEDASVGLQQPYTRRPIMVTQGACGADLYFPQNPPAVSGQVYQAPPLRSRPVRPAPKYKRS